MKSSRLGMFAAVGMLLAGGAVYSVTPAGGFGATREPSPETAAASDTSDSKDKPRESKVGSFESGSTVQVQGLMAQSRMLAGEAQETFMLLELKGGEQASGKPAKVNLAIAIDKSGSMRGSRLENALKAAQTAVERLNDGDSVSVIAFDTRTEVVAPLTLMGPSTRQEVVSAIRRITLGGDTCISCGIEDSLNELKKTGSFGVANDGVARMLLLSDGDATSGVRDVGGFRSIAQRAMSQGVTITTVGVDVDFNENIMAAIALGSNGRHYFVENDLGLARVFEAEAATLSESVASNATAEFELAPGVEVVQLFDRTFSRSGSRISVPLGSFSKGETKTVLLKVRIPASKQADQPIADVRVSYRDLGAGRDVTDQGSLAVGRVDEPKRVAEINGLVLDRIQRSETSSALRDANSLFSLGKTAEAQKRLDKAQQSISLNRDKAAKGAPEARAKDIDSSLEQQQTELDRASRSFASPPADSPAPATAPRQQKSDAKRNIEFANELAL